MSLPLAGAIITQTPRILPEESPYDVKGELGLLVGGVDSCSAHPPNCPIFLLHVFAGRRYSTPTLGSKTLKRAERNPCERHTHRLGVPATPVDQRFPPRSRSLPPPRCRCRPCPILPPGT